MTALRVLIVDDEAPARRRLRRMLERLTNDGAEAIEVVGEAADGVEALTQLTKLEPDLVLLDIQMPALDGLALAQHASLPPFIFVTAFDEHALAAFEVGAADYLLKPIRRERLQLALERARTRIEAQRDASAKGEGASELDELQATLRRLVAAEPAPASPTPPRIAAREGGSVRLFELAEIGRFWSADKYTCFHHGGAEHVLDEGLGELELRLGAHGFVRVHRSELVDLGWVRAVHSEAGATSLELRDGQRVAVSRRMVAEIKRRLGL
ncbi:LytTr DNA-binding domain family protein [Plesiocystis pacifica SIR-1]|uniref:LytTr DNA-binding domain family protein n=1 Tax=Plesiocystis pacifica SIR-1 TaxID=391625 RepID=A6G9H1_9BACT|nr:LytTR family DNA-binding domain-containing protein [Plesiocystis pacifica]EDM77479.1 LytTr DNA-binding domain family protein [Plesiocystis pacifica SIR-1]